MNIAIWQLLPSFIAILSTFTKKQERNTHSTLHYIITDLFPTNSFSALWSESSLGTGI